MNKLEVLVNGEIVFDAQFPSGMNPEETQKELLIMANNIAIGALWSGRIIQTASKLAPIAQREIDFLNNNNLRRE